MSNQAHLPTDDLRAQYIQRRKTELGTYLQALRSKDFETLRHIGHRMRGNGVSFGYPELSVLGEKIEAAANKQELAELRIFSIEFTNWVDEQTLIGKSR
jgi:HPt (histidine-containing phosphotransfer) domain-containing protein